MSINVTIRYARSRFDVTILPGGRAMVTVDNHAIAVGSWKGGALTFPNLRTDIVERLNRKFAGAYHYARR